MSEKTVYVKCELTGKISYDYLEVVFFKTNHIRTSFSELNDTETYFDKAYIHKDLLHESIPQAEPANEWSADKFYTLVEARYLSDKFGLELNDGSTSHWDLGVENKVKYCKLRKPKTVDDKIRGILITPNCSVDYKIQAIKDVFKEEK